MIRVLNAKRPKAEFCSSSTIHFFINTVHTHTHTHTHTHEKITVAADATRHHGGVRSRESDRRDGKASRTLPEPFQTRTGAASTAFGGLDVLSTNILWFPQTLGYLYCTRHGSLKRITLSSVHHLNFDGTMPASNPAPILRLLPFGMPLRFRSDRATGLCLP